MHVVVLLEDDADGHPDGHLLGRAIHDVGRESDVRIFLDLDDGDAVGMSGSGDAGLVVVPGPVGCLQTATGLGHVV